MAKRYMKLPISPILILISPIILETQSKEQEGITSHLKKVTFIQNTSNQYQQVCGEPSCILLRMFTGTATMENSIQVLKKLRLELPCDAAIIIESIFLVRQNHGSKMICTPLYSRHFVDNRQDMEAIKMSIN